MANWVQLVEYTAEFSPGPWHVHYPHDTDRPVAFIVSSEPANLFSPVATVPATDQGEERAGRQGSEWYDPEQFATARLVADAPAMLGMLAVMLNGWEAYRKSAGDVPQPVRNWIEEASKLVARHVRIGYEPKPAPPVAPEPESNLLFGHKIVEEGQGG